MSDVAGTESWEQVLASFSERLSEQRAALAEGDADRVPAFAAPPGIGAVPDALRARAEALLAEARELQEAVEAMMAATSREAHALRVAARHATVPAPPRFFDRRL
ncbi:MAG: hypothetical protein M3Q48_13255 [Actinomycetota bacterium]|nr:hypothetical protein [Actinomycetota bacterium]